MIDSQSSPLRSGVVASLSSADMSVERAARPHGCLLGHQNESKPGGRADRVQVASTLANGTAKALEVTDRSKAQDQAMEINSEGTASMRGGSSVLPRQDPSSISF